MSVSILLQLALVQRLECTGRYRGVDHAWEIMRYLSMKDILSGSSSCLAVNKMGTNGGKFNGGELILSFKIIIQYSQTAWVAESVL